MRIPIGTQLAPRRDLEMPPFLVLPEPEMPFPAASGSVLAPVPQTFPGSSLTYNAFLYSQLQNSVQPGSPNTYTAPQTYQMPADTAALTFLTTGVGAQSKRVKTNLNGLWEIGTNSLYDGADLDYYWKDLTNNAFRMRLDTDGQLSLLGYANTGGVHYNNAVNNLLNLESRPFASAGAAAGFGVGILMRLADAAANILNVGAFNCVLDVPTVGNTATHLDLYAQKAGAGFLALTLDPTNGSSLNTPIFVNATDTATNTALRLQTFEHKTSGVVAAGFGVEHAWQSRDASGNMAPTAKMQVDVTNPTTGSVQSAIAWAANNGGALVEILRLRPGMSTTVDPTSFTNFTGGELWCRGNFRMSGVALGVFDVTPVVQQTGGAATAGGTYTSAEQGMVNRMYSALRAYGFLT